MIFGDKKVIVISQNEEGVIFKDDPNYLGLVTHNLVDCVGVVISSSDCGINILQHHDVHSDVQSITKAIAKNNLGDSFNIRLIVNKFALENDIRGYDSLTGKEISGYDITKRSGGNLFRIADFLRLNSLNFEVINTFVGFDNDGSRISNSGFLLKNDGSLDLEMTLISPNICGNLWRDDLDIEAVSFYLDEIEAIANLKLFDEVVEIFTRYDGHNINDGFQGLTPKNMAYLSRLYDKNIKDKTGIKKQLLQDSSDNIFGSDVVRSRIMMNLDNFAKNAYFILNNLFVDEITNQTPKNCFEPKNNNLLSQSTNNLYEIF